MHKIQDIEKSDPPTELISTFPRDSESDDGGRHAYDFGCSGALDRMRAFEALLDRKLGVEANGPERILPEGRTPPNQWLMATLWASGTMNLSCFATGFLGWEFGLSLQQSVLTVVFGTLLGSMVTGWCATMGEFARISLAGWKQC